MKTSLTRRSLILRSGALLAGAQFAALTPSWSADFRSKPGMQMYMVAAEFKKDPAGTLSKLAAIGYGYVEAYTAIIPDIPAFKRMLAHAGLGCPSGHFGFGFMDTEKALDQASAMDVKYAISSILPPEPPKGGMAGLMPMLNHMTADDFRRQAALANKIGESAHKRGIQFAYHNHNFEFRKVEGSTTGYDILLKETDPALVKLEVDAGWVAAGGGDPVAIIRGNAGRVRLLHFKDFSSVTPPINQLGPHAGANIVDLGKGVAPLKAAYYAAHKAGVEYFIVDHDPPFHGQTTMEAAKSDYDFAAKLMA